MNDNSNYMKALKLFERQIECIMADDRDTQMGLYAEELRYEFPFANDRPRLIEGSKAFRDIMIPLWDEARRQGVKVIGCKHEFHATDEIGLFLAVFALEIKIAENTMSLPFVQLLRIQDDHIVEVREYFSPSRRKEIIESDKD